MFCPIKRMPSFDNAALDGDDIQDSNHNSHSHHFDTEETNDRDDKTTWCGLGTCRPPALRGCAHPLGFLVFICIFNLAQSTAINGGVYVILSTLERRFGLTSTLTGSISGTFDITVLIVVIFVTYLSENKSKPLFIGLGALLFGIGSFTFTLPHFLSEEYKFKDVSSHELCMINGTNEEQCNESSESATSKIYYLFFVSQIIHGIGSSPQYTLAKTYIYDNVNPRSASVHLAFFQGFSSLGPAVGYVMGGAFLSIYSELGVDTKSLGISPQSPIWVGNWWFPFIIIGITALSTSVPLMMYPKQMPDAHTIEEQRKDKPQSGSAFETKKNLSGKLSDFPKALWNLIKNIPFMSVSFASAGEFFIIGCIATFGPKFIEVEFNLSSSTAAYIAGGIAIPAGLVGVILGGYAIKYFDMGFRTRVQFSIAALVVSLLLTFSYMLVCPNIDFAGVTRGYSETTLGSVANISSNCNINCHCADDYNPVCGGDEIMYYSPCHAGCTVTGVANDTKFFSNCSCISSESNSYAKPGRCMGSCKNLPWFFAVTFVCVTTASLAVVPTITMVLMLVSKSQRTTALGIQSIIFRGLGTIPAPVVMGSLIDNTCLLWQNDCDGKTCWVYHNRSFAISMFVTILICRTISIGFYTLAMMMYKPSAENEPDTKELNR